MKLDQFLEKRKEKRVKEGPCFKFKSFSLDSVACVSICKLYLNTYDKVAMKEERIIVWMI